MSKIQNFVAFSEYINFTGGLKDGLLNTSAYKLKDKSISAISIDFHRDIYASLSFTFVTAFAEHAVHVAHAIKRKVLITPTPRQLCSVQCRTTAHSLLGRQYAGVAWLSRTTSYF